MCAGRIDNNTSEELCCLRFEHGELQTNTSDDIAGLVEHVAYVVC
jgi:hypothetical protein